LKKKIVFVGSFNLNSANKGGQLFACTSLIQSELSKEIDWLLIDSTAKTNLQRSAFERSMGALNRLLSLTYMLVTQKPKGVLIFFADRGSLIEKGVMAFLSFLFNKKTVLCPRSGLIISDINKSVFWRTFTKVAFKCSTNVVCQSETWRKFFEDNVLSNHSYIVIKNWIVTDIYSRLYQKRNEMRKEGPFTILFMGWVTKEKGIFDLITALTQLQMTDYILLVAGEGSDIKQAMTTIVELNMNQKVKFLGWVDGEKKLSLFRDSDILVLPSYYEGLPNVVLESMASGLPVIATRVGGIPDIITDGDNGFVVPVGDPSTLANKIDELHQNSALRKQFSERSYEVVKKEHSMESAISKFRDLLI
jgi:glycosyltransferase involved in cell wall biosynthesis